jgi:hypothetical protein
MTDTTLPTLPGTPFAGGFYAGRLRVGDALFALVVAPKAEGEAEHAWGPAGSELAAAASCCDGTANTVALAEAGSGMAKWAQALAIGGHTDWYVPSRDELELLYRHLKPSTHANYASFRDGDNPSSVPAGYPYRDSSPEQTAAEAFRAGGEQAFEEQWYWSSTQFSRHHAWYQYFDDGYQYYGDEDYQARVRAVRRFLIT